MAATLSPIHTTTAIRTKVRDCSRVQAPPSLDLSDSQEYITVLVDQGSINHPPVVESITNPGNLDTITDTPDSTPTDIEGIVFDQDYASTLEVGVMPRSIYIEITNSDNGILVLNETDQANIVMEPAPDNRYGFSYQWDTRVTISEGEYLYPEGVYEISVWVHDGVLMCERPRTVFVHLEHFESDGDGWDVDGGTANGTGSDGSGDGSSGGDGADNDGGGPNGSGDDGTDDNGIEPDVGGLSASSEYLLLSIVIVIIIVVAVLTLAIVRRNSERRAWGRDAMMRGQGYGQPHGGTPRFGTLQQQRYQAHAGPSPQPAPGGAAYPAPHQLQQPPQHELQDPRSRELLPGHGPMMPVRCPVCNYGLMVPGGKGPVNVPCPNCKNMVMVNT